jgi:flagellar hook-associated protein 2
MTSALAVSGLSSGLDTTSLINSLMAAEALPQTQLKSQVATHQNDITALQALNSQLAALATSTSYTALPGALNLFTATSSSNAVTATAGTAASTGSISVVVNAVAQAQVSVTAPMTTWPTTPPTLTIVNSAGTPTTITPASTSLDDAVSAINGSNTGITAMKVASGTDSTGAKQYRLQMNANATGASGAFHIYEGANSTAPDLFAQPGAAQIQAAQDASATLWSGTSAAQTLTSSTNTFTNLLPGVNVTVSAASASPVTITVANDTNQVTTIAKNLVASLDNIFSTVSLNSAVSTGTNANGNPTATSGLFMGDSTVQGVNDSILSAATAPVNGHSPSEIGISISKSGTIDFDQTTFQAALAANPANVASTLQTIASRVSDAARAASDPISGSITTEITGDQATVKDLGNQISDWDLRLAARRATLETTYANLEVALGNLKSQSAWLSAQLGSLPTASTTGTASSGATR